MNENFKLTGGARIGNANATYPFANLFVDKDILKINASIVGNLVFQPKDIISIEPYVKLPIIGQGIKINHRVAGYKSNVIFWTLKNPQLVIEKIKKVGFLDHKDSNEGYVNEEITRSQEQGAFPVKKPVAIIFAFIWIYSISI